MTLQLTDVPEAEALELLLRAAAGYLAAPRVWTVHRGSGRVLIMATSDAPRPASGAPFMTPSFGEPATGRDLAQPPPGFSFMPGGGGDFDPAAQNPSFEADQSEQLQ